MTIDSWAAVAVLLNAVNTAALTFYVSVIFMRMNKERRS